MTSSNSFQASLSRSQGRSSWSVIFRHPTRTDKAGNVGLRVRRGLGVSDEAEAQQLVDQLNEILSDRSMWNPSERASAEQRYDHRIVAAFYDHMTPELHDQWEIRNNELPLPGKEEGYTRALLVGTTGAGKTTLVRQLIGTDPKSERFPSTSTAKTTTSNIEIILTTDATYRAVVTFSSRQYATRHVEESITASARAWLESKNEEELENHFLEHSEQRFRLSYLLGATDIMKYASADKPEPSVSNFDLLFAEEESPPPATSSLSDEERHSLLVRLREYLTSIRMLADTANANLAKEFTDNSDSLTREDKEVLNELLEEQLEREPSFRDLVDDIVEDIEERFLLLQEGEIVRGKDNWPLFWRFNSDNRETFITAVNRFSSNYAPHFGRLLTPVVEGIRVSGRFIPGWYLHDELRLVLMDGEGLGHTPESSSSVSTAITRRYKNADAIIVVDNAAQPMQAAPASVLRSIVSNGYTSKLIVTFTHFDAVTGDNFPSERAKAQHVLRSYENVANWIGKAFKERNEMMLREVGRERMFFLSRLHTKEAGNERVNTEQLRRLILVIQQLAQPSPLPTTPIPTYEDADLVLQVQAAVTRFHDRWDAILGLKVGSEAKEHWARIKALSRRLGEMGQDEYRYLRPVADLKTQLQEAVYLFLQNDVRWDSDIDDATREALIEQIARELDSLLYDYVSATLFESKVVKWFEAYKNHSGQGSTMRRARDIETIYDQAAPPHYGYPSERSRKFLSDIRELVQKALEESSGQPLASAG